MEFPSTEFANLDVEPFEVVEESLLTCTKASYRSFSPEKRLIKKSFKFEGTARFFDLL